MDNTSYIVVGLDGKEYENVKFETIKQWYSNRSLNDSSLVFSPEIGKWQMLKRVFDMNEFHVENTSWQRQNLTTSVPNRQQIPANGSFQNANPSSSTVIRQPASARQTGVGGILAKGAGIVFLLFFVASGLVGVFLKNTGGGQLSAKDQKLLAEIKKYEIPEKHFVDLATGASVTLPNSWRRLNLQNPFFTSEDASLIGFDEMANKGMMLEITSVAENIDRAEILEKSVPLLEEMLRKESTSYKTIAAATFPMKGMLAKKLTFERLPVKTPNPYVDDNTPRLVSGTMIVAVKSRNIYILQLWCGKEDLASATAEFANIENSFTVPDSK